MRMTQPHIRSVSQVYHTFYDLDTAWEQTKKVNFLSNFSLCSVSESRITGTFQAYDISKAKMKKREKK